MKSPRNPGEDAIQVVQEFNQALNDGDVEAMIRLTSPDSVFENTYPPPEGTRFAGQAEIRRFWLEFFQGSQQPRIEIEEIFGLDQRVVMRWVYHWVNLDGTPGRIRGVDVYRVEDQRITEKLSYVKG